MKLAKFTLRCVTFDITNTLLKVSSSVGQHYSDIAKKYVSRASRGGAKRRVNEAVKQDLHLSRFDYHLDAGQTNKCFRKYFKQLNRDYPGYGIHAGISSREWWYRMVYLIAEENESHKPTKSSPDLIRSIADKIYDEFGKVKYWKKYDSSDELLRTLKSHQIKLGVISNFDERLLDIIASLNWMDYFEFIQIPFNSNGFYKPRAEIFNLALERSHASSPAELFHVGDDYELDYLAAKKAGWNSVLLKHGFSAKDHSDVQTQELIRTGECLPDLDSLLKRLVQLATG